MRIAQVAPLYEAVPPVLYGGTERVAAHLTDALVELGHDVTLFSTADARTRAKLVVVRDQPIRLDPAPLKSDLAAHLTLLAEVLERADDFDIIHFHTDMLHFPFFADRAARTVTTLHGRLDLKDLAEVYGRWTQFPLVSISDDQRRPIPAANWQATVQHGMPSELYEFSPKSAGYLVDTVEEAVEATARAVLLDRAAIRARFEQRFSAEAMARRYLEVYAELQARADIVLPTVIDPLIIPDVRRAIGEDRAFAPLA